MMNRNLAQGLWVALSLWLPSCTEQEEKPVAKDSMISSLSFRHTTPKYVQDYRLSHYISSQPGTIYSEEKVDDDIRSVFESGYIEDLRFLAEPDGDSVHLIASVSNRRGFGPVVLVGNQIFSDQKLWKQISEPLATRISDTTAVVYDLATDEPVVHRDDSLADKLLPAVCEELERFYRSEGFPDAKVTIKSWDSGTATADDFVFVIEEQPGDE